MEDALPGSSDFDFAEDITPRRQTCSRCKRPIKVCLCHWMPTDEVELEHSRILILQHPNEQRRPLRTASILEACLSLGSCSIYKGRRFTRVNFEELHSFLKGESTILLFPAPGAIALSDVNVKTTEPSKKTNILIIDGTWKQAKEIYNQNEFLHGLQKIVIDTSTESEYVIRTQPTEGCLSTLECAALALARLEGNSSIREVLMKPLRALCHYQLDHGEQVHQPRDKLAKNILDSKDRR